MENELKTLKREEMEKLGKAVSVSRVVDIPKEEAIEQLIKEGEIPQVYEAENTKANESIKKPKKRISMKKTAKNTTPRVLKFLETRRPTKTEVIAKALGMGKKENIKGYKLIANLLLRMRKNGLIKKYKTGFYYVLNEKTKNINAIKPHSVTTEQRMANMREAKRQKKIEKELMGDVPKYNVIDKLENLMRLRQTVGKSPSFYRRVDKQISAIILHKAQPIVSHKEIPFKALNNGKIINTGQHLSGFRLIKNYPNSPYAIGVVVKGSPDLFNYPEFWQPQYTVVEPEQVIDKNNLQEAWNYMQQAMELLKKATLK